MRQDTGHRLPLSDSTDGKKKKKKKEMIEFISIKVKKQNCDS